MSVEDAHLLLEATKSRLKQGYAKDLVTGILNGMNTAYDADCLFRSIMLDERWNLIAAEGLFVAANIVMDDQYHQRQKTRNR